VREAVVGIKHRPGATGASAPNGITPMKPHSFIESYEPISGIKPFVKIKTITTVHRPWGNISGLNSPKDQSSHCI
jgi:hypothetical protein